MPRRKPSTKYFKWCKKGCGKKVEFFKEKIKHKGKIIRTYYQCRKCKKIFTKEEIKNA